MSSATKALLAMVFLAGTTVGAVMGAELMLLLKNNNNKKRGDDEENGNEQSKAIKSRDDETQGKEEGDLGEEEGESNIEQIPPTAAAPQTRPTTTAEEHLWDIVKHSFTGALLHVGDELQLYDRLWQIQQQEQHVSDTAAPRGVTVHQLAAQTGWSERWLTEFLSQAAAAGICQYHPPVIIATSESVTTNTKNGTFALRPEYATLLCNPDDHPDSMAGMFQFLLPLLHRSDAVVQAMQTGKGFGYDWGPNVNLAIDRKNRNWFARYLINQVLAPITIPMTGESLVAVLERGGVSAADVGCGCGASTVVLARRFPATHFYAYESSQQALAVLRQRTANLPNVTVCDVSERTLGDGPNDDNNNSNTFAFVYSHDVLHDMAYPRDLITNVYRTLSTTNGCWVIVDVQAEPALADNLAKPAAELLYGFSCLLCLASSTAETGGEQLGTLGLSLPLLRQWTQQAGFDYTEQQPPLPSAPLSAVYVVARHHCR